MSCVSVELATIIVGHLAPDLDCLTAIWILMRFGGMSRVELAFVPAGTTYHNQLVDQYAHIIHVDTGGGRFDHHQRTTRELCAAELVRRSFAPTDQALQRMVQQVTRIDHATASENQRGFFSIQALINGYNALFPEQPREVASAMLPNLDAWYATETRQLRLEEAFDRRIEFQTPWGLGIAMESVDGGSSRLAFGRGAVLYVYRNTNGWMGIVAQARAPFDLSELATAVRRADPQATWYLHSSRRLLLCGTAKAPTAKLSQLSLEALVQIIQGREVPYIEYAARAAVHSST